MPLQNPVSFIDTFTLLDDYIAVLVPGTNTSFFWPFLEASGDIARHWGTDVTAADLDVTAGSATVGIAADDLGLSPYQHLGGVYSYQFVLANSPALVASDAAALTFVSGGNDTALSIGCWFYRGTTGGGTLMAKYDVAGTAREYKLDIDSNDLRLVLYDESANVEEGVRTTTALNAGQWYFGVVTYSGVGGGGGGEAADGMTVYIDGSSVADTDIDNASYVDMEDIAAPFLIGATDDKAAPASEFTGRIALPFMVATELTSANVSSLYSIGRKLLNL